MLPLLLSLSVLSFAFLTASEAKAQSAVNLPIRDVSTIAQITGASSAKSASGREIELINVHAAHDGASQPKHRILIEGGLHGDEVMTTEFVHWLASRVARSEGPLATLLGHDIAFDFIPQANPDGVSQGLRANAHGVNLNRNFGVLWGLSSENPGSGSFSEPETRALRKLFKARHYTAAVDVHGYVNWIVTPSAPEALSDMGKTPAPAKVAAYQSWLRAIAAHAAALPKYEIKTGAELGDGGAFEDWAFWSQGTFAYCLEIEKLAGKNGGDVGQSKLEMFLRYERFVYSTVVSAVSIADDAALAATIAVKS